MAPSALLGDTASSLSPSITAAVAALTIFLLAKYIYRVTFHPLATFPGPKLAALTTLYGAFYDMLPIRSYCELYPTLHDKYGPIIRIRPNHLHIRDIEAYNQIFKIGTHFDKDAPFYALPPLKGSFFSIPSTKIALARRSMYSHLFSKEGVRRSEHLITGMLAKFFDVLSDHVSGVKPVDLSIGLRCLTADISMNFTFQRPFNALDAKGFDSELVKGIYAFTGVMLQWFKYFPRFVGGVSSGTACLPGWFIDRMVKPFALVNRCLGESREQITYLQKHSSSERGTRTVFDICFNPNREKGQFTPTVDQMAADAFGFLTAGTDTSANTIEVILWALLNNPQMMQRLKAELREIMPSPTDAVDWIALEKLPYLRAVIKEGLRLSYGVPGLMPRVVPPSGAVFCGQTIPAGTLVSSSQYTYHQDPTAFPSPDTFQPTRWLGASPDAARDMESKWMPFSRGSRSCIGSHLALAVLHLTLARFLRRFDVANAGTTEADMQWDDCFVPKTRGHLRVVVRECVD